MLGSPNKHLSNSHILRWEKDGRVAMKIDGSKAGIWYDFSKGEGGDLFTLVQREKNCDFVEAKKYLQQIVGMPNSKDLRANLVVDKNKQVKTNDQQEKCAEMVKIKRAKELYEKSDSVKYAMPDNVAKKYLSEHRGIKKVLTRYQLSKDLRINMMWDKRSRQYDPALIAFARDKEGNITGGQSIYLNKETGTKADIEVNKRSFGKIRGSFVEISKNAEQKNVQSNKHGNNSVSNITIIAEGVETALSIQESGVKGKILCSLGISNIRNYEPIKGERIIIAADNDGKEAVSVNTVIKAKEELISKGAIVSIIMPQDMGDFNDMLKSKGAESVRKFIGAEVAKLTEEANLKLLSDIKAGSTDNNNLLQEVQNAVKSLSRFGTKEDVSVASQIHQEKGLESLISYSR